MKITRLQVFPLKSVGQKTIAFARITLDDALCLNGIRIIEGQAGIFVSYPNDPSWRGEDYKSLFYPLTRELREYIESEIIKAYNEAVKNET